MKIGRGVSELWRVENLPLPLTWPMAYATACTTVQAVMKKYNIPLRAVPDVSAKQIWAREILLTNYCTAKTA